MAINTADIKSVAQFKRLALKWMAVEIDLVQFSKNHQYAKEILTTALNTKHDELRTVAEQLVPLLQGGGGNYPLSSGQGGIGDGGKSGNKYVHSLR